MRSEWVAAAVLGVGALLAPAAARTQGVGLPPLYDLAPVGRNSLQFEGAASSSDAAAYAASVGLRLRHDWRALGLLGGGALLGDGRFGYALALSAQLRPVRTYLRDDHEHALTAAISPILDANVRGSDALGHAYTGSLALAFALTPLLAGYAVDLTVAPRLELRRVSKQGDARNQGVFGAQAGAAVGVAPFIQLLLMADWAHEGLRAPGLPRGPGGWTLGAGMRARLPQP